MENASKALLIAGAILIAILLIAMGVGVFNSTIGTTEQVEGSMVSAEITTFNSKFTQYAGQNKSLAQVKALANVVIANNAVNTQKQVNFNGTVQSHEITSMLLSYLENQKYTIYIGYSDKGYVDTVHVY